MNDDGSSTLWSLIVLGVFVFSGYLIYTNFIKNDWIGLYEVPTTMKIQRIDFKNKEACVEWLNTPSRHTAGSFSHECGKNCKEPDPSRPAAIYTCKDTYSEY